MAKTRKEGGGGNCREASEWPHIHESNWIWILRIDWRWFQIDRTHRSGDNPIFPRWGHFSVWGMWKIKILGKSVFGGFLRCWERSTWFWGGKITPIPWTRNFDKNRFGAPRACLTNNNSTGWRDTSKIMSEMNSTPKTYLETIINLEK